MEWPAFAHEAIIAAPLVYFWDSSLDLDWAIRRNLFSIATGVIACSDSI